MCCQFCFVGSGTVRIHRLCVACFFSTTFQLNNNLQFGLIKFLFASTILRPSQPFFTFLSCSLRLFSSFLQEISYLLNTLRRFRAAFARIVIRNRFLFGISLTEEKCRCFGELRKVPVEQILTQKLWQTRIVPSSSLNQLTRLAMAERWKRIHTNSPTIHSIILSRLFHRNCLYPIKCPSIFFIVLVFHLEWRIKRAWAFAT